jgi:hypothetical protein
MTYKQRFSMWTWGWESSSQPRGTLVERMESSILAMQTEKNIYFNLGFKCRDHSCNAQM